MAAIVLALVVGVVAAPSRAATARPAALPAQATSATDGVRILTATQTAALAPGGQTVTVSGSGYDEARGVYVALCVITPPGTQPGPCGGGQDRAGASGASAWISSNPPAYAEGLPVPYTPGGGFRVDLAVGAQVAPGVDCRLIGCAIVSRSDHTRSADRGQDVFLPVTFAADPVAPGDPVPVDPIPTTVPTVVTTTTTTTAPPQVASTTTTLAEDGHQVGDGTRTMRLDRVEGLAPDGDEVLVSGAGFDTTRGVYVALCGPPGEAGGPYAPCAAGGENAVWISSSPPVWGADLARPYDEGGAFEVTLALDPRIDDAVDCTVAACSVVVRGDDVDPLDRGQELAIPVRFDGDAADDATTTTSPDGQQVAAAMAVEDGDGDGGGAPLALVALLAVVVLGAGGAAFAVRRRSGEGASDATGPSAEGGAS